MKVVRRVHLYTGLFMTPWVFLYGISAFLLNHPDSVSDQPVAALGSANGTPADATLDPEALAERVVAALNRRAAAAPRDGASSPPGGVTATAYRLIPGAAEFNRDLNVNVRGEVLDYNVRLDLPSGAGTVRDVPRKAVKVAPFVAKQALKLDPPPFEPILQQLPERLRRDGHAAKEATLRLAPDLIFFMQGAGATWRVTFNGQTGVVGGRATPYETAPTARRSMILMHVAHGFPNHLNARWVWAVGVDAMFLSMVGWGVTGLLMWFQMKNLRRVGALVLVASVITAAVVAWQMHATFIAEGLS